jgi:hypothetical protein
MRGGSRRRRRSAKLHHSVKLRCSAPDVEQDRNVPLIGDAEDLAPPRKEG